MIDQVLGVVCLEAKNANCLQGFQVRKSIGGGTGSDIGTTPGHRLAAVSEYAQNHIFFQSHHDHRNKHAAGEAAR
jgi:hypothetical protein